MSIGYTNEMVLRTLRTQAWERAKGELRAVLQSYWEREEGHFTEMEKVVGEFITNVEDNGLQE